MATTPPQIDRTTGAILIAYLLCVGTLVILAEVFVPKSGLGDKILTLAAPVGAVLLLARNQQKTQDAATRIEDKTDEQTTKIEKIEHAVNGEMSKRFADVKQEQQALREDMRTMQTDVQEIKDALYQHCAACTVPPSQ